MISLSLSHLVSTCSLVLYLFTSLTQASPTLDLQDIRARQSQLVVTGVQDGGVQFRKSIGGLSRDEMNILLLAMQRFQAADSSDPLSYYQIAGIHGQPYMSWAGVQPRSGGQNSGYCTHVSPLFSTWHRPYLALFEQALHRHAQDVANDYRDESDRARYGAVARDLRLPYWDWAAPQGGSSLHEVFAAPVVSVRAPSGEQTIDNPLYSYEFDPATRNQINTQYARTVRSPTGRGSSAQSRNEVVASRLDNSRDSLRQRLYNLLTTYDDFRAFGSNAWTQSNNQDADSLEGVHDTVHGLVGGGGHMNLPFVSAFDPIFFFHHCMVDRVFAMWQVLYPDSYVQPASSETGTFSIPPNIEIDTDSALTPFRSNGGYWTSESSRSTADLGYVYSETSSRNANDVRQAVNALYGNNFRIRKRQVDVEEDSADGPLSSSNDTIAENNNGTVHEYFANVKVGKHSLDGSFSIYVFLGDVDSAPESWPVDPDLVGLHAVFADHDTDIGGSAAAADMNIKTTAAIPLTEALQAKIDAGELESLELEDVEPYLRTSLLWRVAMVS